MELTWLRPWLATVLLPWLGAVVWWWYSRHGQGRWRHLVDAHLLNAVTVPGASGNDKRLVIIAMVIGVLVATALAGPSWRSTPVPLFRDLSARIIVLDVSPSMLAIDVSPNRLAVAKNVVTALLRNAPGRQLGLVVFAGDAFTVAPLTRDAATLLHLLHSIEHKTLPRAGARVDLGLARARTLLQAADIARGDVYLVGDSPGDTRTLKVAEQLQQDGFPLSVIAIGSERGGPIRVDEGAFAMADGEIVVTRLNAPAMAKLAKAGRGTFEIARTDRASGLEGVGATRSRPLSATSLQSKQLPVDDGYWLVLLTLPLFLLLCRRGWLMSMGWLVLVLPTEEALANSWADWWARPDQQAAALHALPSAALDPELETKLAPWPKWRAIVLMRAGEYERAVRLFAAFEDATSQYNRGNAHALSGDLQGALNAYDQALSMVPDMHDALFNRALVREALARQREQNSRGENDQPRQPRGSAGNGDAASNESQDATTPPTPPPSATSSTDPAAASDSHESASDTPTGDERDEAEHQAQAGELGAEIRRLEGLLAKIPDEPGALLQNRFAIEFKLRSGKHSDTGAQW